jgi:hypothetical protein
MFRLSSLSHLQVVSLGYFNIQFTLLFKYKSLLHKFFEYAGYNIKHTVLKTVMEKAVKLNFLACYKFLSRNWGSESGVN